MITRTEMLNYSMARDEYAANISTDAKGYCNVYVGGSGSDVVTNYSGGTKIHTGAGNDTVNSIAGAITIDTADGDDAVIAVGAGLDIDVGNGNDMTYSQGIENYINRGNGSDTVYSSGYGGTVISYEDDNQADVTTTPAFEFDYVKEQGFVIAPWCDLTEDILASILGVNTAAEEEAEEETQNDTYYS